MKETTCTRVTTGLETTYWRATTEIVTYAGVGVVSILLGACVWVEATLSISLIGLAEEMGEVRVGNNVGDNIGGEVEGEKWEVEGETVEGKWDEAWVDLE